MPYLIFQYTQKQMTHITYMQAICSDANTNYIVYSFTPPSVTPAIIYFDKRRYTTIIGTIATVLII